MFEDSFVESGGAGNSFGSWSKTFSFVAQAIFLGLLVLLPLINTQGLPKHQFVIHAIAQPPSRPTQEVPAEQVKERLPSIGLVGVRAPSRIPKLIADLSEEISPAGAAGIAGDRPGGVSFGTLFGIADVASTQAVIPKLVLPPKVRVSSGVAEGMLLYKTLPPYPAVARQARIQGSVVLQAVIGKDGKVKALRALSGHPMLLPAALDAVKQWRYQPYYLNGDPVEVDTQVTLNFRLTE